MGKKRGVLKLLSVIILSVCIFNLIPQLNTKAETLTSSQKTEEELKYIINNFGEDNIIFEDGITLSIGESIDVSSSINEFNISEIISNNEDVVSIENNSLIGVNEGVTFLITKIEDKYYVSQVYVQEQSAVMLMNEGETINTRAFKTHYTVFVDAGHGGTDPGAIANGIKEKDINLSIALKVRNKLSNLGVDVTMNRETDVFVDYRDTAVMANNSNADVFISIHSNSATASASGIETLYCKDIDKQYSQEIQSKLISYTGAIDRGIKERPNLVVLNSTKMPAALVESGFITNVTEADKLKTDSYQEKLANAIVDGIIEYLQDNVKLDTIPAQRIYGDTRYETSYKVFESGWDKSDTAILVSGLDYPDALCATPLAAKYNAPILLVRNTNLANQEELKNLLLNKGVKNAIIIGGQGVIPADVELELSNIGISNKRIGGSTRFETSVLIANEVGNSTGEVVITSGRGFADGISISSVAAAKGIPILISEANSLPQVVRDYVNNNNISKTYVVGGEGVLTPTLVSTLKNPERIGGADRYSTNKMIFDRFYGDLNLSEVYIAAATQFPDALSSSAIAASKKSFVILSDTNGVRQSCKDIISNNRQFINKVNILSSNKVILDSVINSLGIRIQ